MYDLTQTVGGFPVLFQQCYLMDALRFACLIIAVHNNDEYKLHTLSNKNCTLIYISKLPTLVCDFKIRRTELFSIFPQSI